MLSQSAFLFIAKVLGFAIRLALPVALVRIMTKADVGMYSQFFVLETMLATIFRMGISQSQFFFVPRHPKEAGGILVNSLVSGLALFTIGYTLVGVFRSQAAALTGMPVVKVFFWQIAIRGYVLMAVTTCINFLAASKRFLSCAVAELGVQVLVSVASVAAAFMTRDLETVFWALNAASGLGLVILVAYIHFSLGGFRSERYFFDFWKQIKYGIVLGLSGSTWAVLMRMHYIFVSRYFDLETYAVYAQGLRQIPVLQFYSQSIIAVALVQFAHLHNDGDWDAIKKLWNRILAALYGVGVPVTVVLVLIAHPLVIFMFTKDYRAAIPVFQINAIAMLFQLLNPSLVLRAMDRNDVMLKVLAVVLVLTPVALYLGMKGFGIYGVIGAHAVILITGRASGLVALNRLVPVRLGFFPHPTEVMQFYRDGWKKSVRKLRSVTSR